ncbi:MarR family transcriptional regulator [Streptomyces sp. ICC1]|nr:MarR family transcriptional regulator [Streptomyces sp. ICC4]AWZ17700.1 MarR family transcriptional regulator [Streptomyces sp. ICC1]
MDDRFDGLLDDEAVILLGQMLRATHVVLSRAVRDLAEAGVNREQFEVLLRLARHPGGAARMTVLAEEMAFSSGGFTRFVDRMERDGLLVRGPDPDDRRAVRVSVTKKGEALLREALAVHAPRLHGYLLDPLTEEERRVMTSALVRLDRWNSAGRD